MNECIFHFSSEFFWQQRMNIAKCGTFDCVVTFRYRIPKYLKSSNPSISKENLFSVQSFLIHFDKEFILNSYNGKTSGLLKEFVGQFNRF